MNKQESNDLFEVLQEIFGPDFDKTLLTPFAFLRQSDAVDEAQKKTPPTDCGFAQPAKEDSVKNQAPIEPDYKESVHVRQLKDLPADAHYVIITEESFSYDDGYGERGEKSMSTHQNISYHAIYDPKELEAEVTRLAVPSAWSSAKQFRVLQMKPVNVSVKTVIDIE